MREGGLCPCLPGESDAVLLGVVLEGHGDSAGQLQVLALQGGEVDGDDEAGLDQVILAVRDGGGVEVRVRGDEGALAEAGEDQGEEVDLGKAGRRRGQGAGM